MKRAFIALVQAFILFYAVLYLNESAVLIFLSFFWSAVLVFLSFFWSAVLVFLSFFWSVFIGKFYANK